MWLSVRAEHGLHRRQEARIVAARLVDESRAVRRRRIQRSLEDGARALKC